MNYLPDDLVARNPDWRYADFEQKVWQIYTALQQQQIQTLALWFEDSAKLACTLLACWHANVRTLLLPNLTPQSQYWAKQQTDDWLTDGDVNVIQQAVQTATGQNALNCGVKINHFDDFASPIKITPPTTLANFNPATEFWLTTSGSTGSPKTIVKTAGQLWKNAQICAKAFGFLPAPDEIIRPKTTAVCTVSIQHLYGLICQVMIPLVLGWQQVRQQQFFPENVAQICRQAEQAVLISSPTMLTSIDWQSLKFPHLQGIISAGGLLNAELAEKIQQAIGFYVTDFYGTTEAGAIAMRQGSGLWQPMPTANIGVDERSALWIEADWIGKREQGEDIVELTPNGFSILGRADRIIKLGDKRISLSGVEQDLLSHCFIKDCYIGKFPSSAHQHRLAAWVALNEKGLQAYQHSRADLVKVLKNHLAQTQDKVALPRFWRFTDHLPRNSQSKISKQAFEQICLAKQRDQFGN